MSEATFAAMNGTLLTVCTYAAILVGGISGLLGTIWETKDKEGRLTRFGRAAVGVVCTSLLLAVAMQVLSDVQAKRDGRLAQVAQAQAQKELQEQTLRAQNLERQQTRLLAQFMPSDVKATFSLTLPAGPSDVPGLAEYLSEHRAEFEGFATLPIESQRERSDIAAYGPIVAGQPTRLVRIPDSSPLYPKGRLRSLLDDLAVRVVVIDEKMALDSFNTGEFRSKKIRPALNVSLEGGRRAIVVDLVSRTVSLSCIATPGVEPDIGVPSNAVASLMDLAGTHLFLYPVAATNPTSSDKGVVHRVARGATLRVDRLSFGRYSIEGGSHLKNLARTVNSEGFEFSALTFPAAIRDWFPGAPGGPVHAGATTP